MLSKMACRMAGFRMRGLPCSRSRVCSMSMHSSDIGDSSIMNRSNLYGGSSGCRLTNAVWTWLRGVWLLMLRAKLSLIHSGFVRSLGIEGVSPEDEDRSSEDVSQLPLPGPPRPRPRPRAVPPRPPHPGGLRLSLGGPSLRSSCCPPRCAVGCASINPCGRFVGAPVVCKCCP